MKKCLAITAKSDRHTSRNILAYVRKPPPPDRGGDRFRCNNE